MTKRDLRDAILNAIAMHAMTRPDDVLKYVVDTNDDPDDCVLHVTLNATARDCDDIDFTITIS